MYKLTGFNLWLDKSFKVLWQQQALRILLVYNQNLTSEVNNFPVFAVKSDYIVEDQEAWDWRFPSTVWDTGEKV